jgi:Asp-tRNA(Asn)/Glu-tRNA(Gln) amidotransferase A subunit family amidase
MTAVDADLDFASAEALAAMVRARRISPSELLEHTLARIAALNPSLGAFVALDEEGARAGAARQTERLARGEDLGPLGGLPFGVKDLEDVEGMPTTRGSRAFRDAVAIRDEVHVERLRRAGAIFVGKTNTPEFGYTAYSANDLFPTTRNPWDLERTPGGSSGGAGAAIASGMVAVATASDGGGSIRIPASFVGAYGLKSSFGRVPIGLSDFLGWMDTGVYGPLTRTVRDAAIYLDAVCGYHPADPNSLPHPGYRYLDRLDEPLPRLRIAFSPTLGATYVQSDVAREVAAAVDVFRAIGHEVVERHDEIPSMGTWWGLMGGFQRAAWLWDVYLERRDEIGEAPLRGMDAALGLGPEEFGEFARRRAELNRWLWALFDDFDLLLTPTMPFDAFAADGPMPAEVEGERVNAIAFTAPFNFSGHPAASVRAGFTDRGLPVGLQIAGPRHRDDLVLQASLAYERERPWHDRWPDL